MTLTEQYHTKASPYMDIIQICHFVCKLCCTLSFLRRSQPPSCIKRHAAMETQSLHYFPDSRKENISITQYYSIISIKRHLIIILLHCQLLNNRNSDQCHTAVSKSISIQACKSAFMNSDTKASSHMQCQVLHNTLT